MRSGPLVTVVYPDLEALTTEGPPLRKLVGASVSPVLNNGRWRLQNERPPVAAVLFVLILAALLLAGGVHL